MKRAETAESLGLTLPEENDHQVIQHIFDAQFSTKQEVTELSGRGVGLDAVKFEVEKLGGRIWVESRVGKGSQFWIELPWKTRNRIKFAA